MMSISHSKERCRARTGDIEMFRLCSRWLSRKDQVFLRMVLDNGSTFEQIARLTGESPSTVSRRFQRLLEKLIHRRLLRMLKAQTELDSRTVRVLQEYYIKGQSQQAIAARFNISVYRIRRILQTARTIAAGGPQTPRPLSRNTINRRQKR